MALKYTGLTGTLRISPSSKLRLKLLEISSTGASVLSEATKNIEYGFDLYDLRQKILRALQGSLGIVCDDNAR
jgi:hypothetical protein